MRCPLESLSHIFNWSVKVFSFSNWSMQVIFTRHNLEIMLEFSFNHFSLMSLWWFWVHWLSSFPVISTLWKLFSINMKKKEIIYKSLSINGIWIFLNVTRYLLDFRIKEMMISDAVWWSFIDIFHLISILMLTAMFIKVLFIMGMVAMIIFTIGHICSIIPLWYVSFSWEVNSIYEIKIVMI